MHENNFEKQVREKMDRLGFDPADAVWANVDKEINRERKRRSPVFWIFFLTGIMIAGGGYYILIKKEANPAAIANRSTGIVRDRGDARETKPGKSPTGTEGEKMDNRTLTPMKQNLNGASIFVHTVKKTKSAYGITGFSRKVANDPEKYSSADWFKDKIIGDTNEDQHKNEIAEGDSRNSQHNELNDKPDSADSSSHEKQLHVVENKHSIKDSLSETKTAKNKNKDRKLSSWKIGFTGNAGISGINQTLFKSGAVLNSYYTPNNAGGSNLSSVNSSSYIRAAFSFGAGAFGIRNLSDRVSISAGLNYHYYSTEIQVGSLENKTITVNSIPGQQVRASSYYENGRNHNYTNQYHFIELPVSLNYKLNRSPRMPFIWEGGLSVAYLLGSNALNYDPLTNTYYAYNKLLNNTQLNVATAVMIGFPIYHYTLQAGPQFEYGLTKLLKSSAGTPGHVLYYGLKISFIR